MKLLKLLLVDLAFMVSLCLASIAHAAVTAPMMTVLLKPSAMSEAKGGYIDVKITVPSMNVAAGKPLFKLADMAPSMPSPQPRTNVSITDAEGPVPLVVAAENAGSHPWTSSRRVHGTVVVKYRLPIDNDRGSGPPINIHIDGHSFSAPGRMLVAIPAKAASYRVAIRWDLSAMKPGAIGVSSYGYGNVEIPAGAPATASSRLIFTAFAAGHFTREPKIRKGGFTALWGGEPPFDTRSLMRWTSKLHEWMSKFFQLDAEPFYLVILRKNPQNPGGGVAYTNAFVVGYGADTTAKSLKRILAHEMVHTFTTSNETLDKWYAEGMAQYYSVVLPWRAGLISNEQFLKWLNITASRYYTDVKKNTPEDQVLANFWKDTRVRTLPYDRGMMYFAVVDSKIRKASNGEKSVDDIIRDMVSQSHHHKVAVDTWINLLNKYLGKEGPATYHALMAGKLMVPDSNEFGPCFKRVTRKVRQFDMGFDKGPNNTVQNLEPDSEAAKAGVRDGDKVLSGRASDKLQAHVHQAVTLKLLRNGKQLSVTYLPRGAAVDAYQWARVAGIPDSACRPPERAVARTRNELREVLLSASNASMFPALAGTSYNTWGISK